MYLINDSEKQTQADLCNWSIFHAPNPLSTRKGSHTSNCQCAACRSCFAWSAAHPAVRTNWFIITWCFRSSIFAEAGYSKPFPLGWCSVLEVILLCTTPFLSSTMETAQSAVKTQIFTVWTMFNVLSAPLIGSKRAQIRAMGWGDQ
jgi:hypothetical protein